MSPNLGVTPLGEAGKFWGRGLQSHLSHYWMTGPLQEALGAKDVFLGNASVRGELNSFQRLGVWLKGGLPLALLGRAGLPGDQVELHWSEVEGTPEVPYPVPLAGLPGVDSPLVESFLVVQGVPRTLRAVRLVGKDGGYVEWRSTGQVREGRTLIEQHVHFPEPYLGQEGLTLPFWHDSVRNCLVSGGPTRINRRVTTAREVAELGSRGVDVDGTTAFYVGEHTLTGGAKEAYVQLVAPSLGVEFAMGNLTFPPNTGMWRGVMANLLADPNLVGPGEGLGVDLSRTTIERLSFTRGKEHPFHSIAGSAAILVFPVAVRQRKGGEELTAFIELCPVDGITRPWQATPPTVTVGISLYVTGNLPLPGTSKEALYQRPRLRDLQLGRRGGRMVPLTMISYLKAFGELSGDSNPLHADLRVARLAGFPTTPVHGLALASQVETLLRQAMGGKVLQTLSLSILKPAFPGEELRLEFREEGTRGIFQVIRQKGEKRTLLAEGDFA